MNSAESTIIKYHLTGKKITSLHFLMDRKRPVLLAFIEGGEFFHFTGHNPIGYEESCSVELRFTRGDGPRPIAMELTEDGWIEQLRPMLGIPARADEMHELETQFRPAFTFGYPGQLYEATWKESPLASRKSA